MAPISVPVSGSWTGAAAQVHEWTVRTRCSAEWICTGSVDGERGAHRVRADRVFRPAHARRQPDGIGRAQQAARALAPQDGPVRVGDDHDVHGLVRDAHQRAAQQRQDGSERVRGPDPVEVGGPVDDGRVEAVRVDAGGQAAAPRLGDERARCGPAGGAGEDGVVDLVQRPGPLDRVAGVGGARRGVAGNGAVVMRHGCALVRHEHLEHRRRRTDPFPNHHAHSSGAATDRPTACNVRAT